LYTGEKRFSESIVLTANVVHGFKRGSKELGIPTANLNMEQLGEQGESLETGIYYGWSVLNGVRYETVVSVGWNPFYKNSKKTVEAHLLAKMDDFYGEELRVELLGYLRQEANFNGIGNAPLYSSCVITHLR
jgi:riboflavin kinase